MPGFFALYEGTERVDVGNGYWVDVRKNLTHEQMQRAQAKMGAGKQHVDMGGRKFMDIDMNAFQDELLAQSIVDWNLDDADGEKLPVQPERVLRATIARLPSGVSQQVFDVCNRLNGTRDKAEAARFPDRAGDGGEERDPGAAGAGELPGEGGVLGPPGGDQAEPEDAPVA